MSHQEDISRQQREQARLAALKEAAEEEYERNRQKVDLIRDLASSEGSAEKILARNKAAALKRSSARRVNDEHQRISMTLTMPRMEDVGDEEEGPFDPLDGQGEESSLYVVHQSYADSYDPARNGLMKVGLMGLRMILLHWREGLLCMMCINGDYLKHMLDWDVYYLMNWLQLEIELAWYPSN